MGRYDKLVGELTNDIFNHIKKPSKIYKRFPNKNLNRFNYIDTYKIPRGFEFDVWCEFYRCELVAEIYVNGCAYIKDAQIDITVMLNPDDEPNKYNELRPELKSTIRHEIEHLTHSRTGYNVGYKRLYNNDMVYRNKIDIHNIDSCYKYFLLKTEIDCNVHGMYMYAKDTKLPYKSVVNNWLDKMVNDGEIRLKHKREIYNKMKKRAKQIGGLPEL